MWLACVLLKMTRQPAGSTEGDSSAASVGYRGQDQEAIDAGMNELDGTDDKSKLGANAVLAVSLAVAKAGASVANPNGSL